MKLLWDAVGTEFAGRHKLYEELFRRPEDIGPRCLTGAQRGGGLKDMEALVDSASRIMT